MNSKADNKIVIAFDAYGTLLSTESIAKKLAAHFGAEQADAVAAAWRKYQLEYTWRLNSMGKESKASFLRKKKSYLQIPILNANITVQANTKTSPTSRNNPSKTPLQKTPSRSPTPTSKPCCKPTTP